jgi:hypothetical protein
MTNKTKTSLGAAGVVVAAVATMTLTPHKPEPYVFNGFAEVEQHFEAEARDDGANVYNFDFYCNPDRLIEEASLETNWVTVLTNRLDISGRMKKHLEKYPTYRTNVTAWHPGIVLVWANGERIGTNLVAGFQPRASPEYLLGLVARAMEAEAGR